MSGHLDKGRGDDTAGGRMLAEETIRADRVLALDIPGEVLSIGLNEPRVHKVFALAALKPEPGLLVDRVSSEWFAVFLPCRQVFAGLWHVGSLEHSSVRKVDRFKLVGFKFWDVVIHDAGSLPALDLVRGGVGLTSGSYSPAATVGSVFCHTYTSFPQAAWG